MLPSLPDGLKAEFAHIRRNKPRYPGKFDQTTELDPRGGRTACSLLDEAGKEVAHGIAICHENDNYSKQIGRNISLGRALKMYETGEEVDPFAR